MVCRLALRNSVILPKPVSHSLICHEPMLKIHPTFWFYGHQSEISIDFNAARLLLSVTRESQAWRWPGTATSWHLCRDLSANLDLFSRSGGSWAQTPHMWYRASADKPCFDLSRSLKTRAAQEMHIKSRRKDLCTHTQHRLSFFPCPLPLPVPKCQIPAHMDTLPSSNTGFSRKL